MMFMITTAPSQHQKSRNGIAEADKWGSQTPVYTSDFSAGADSWTTIANAAVTGNTDSINGSDNWLKVEKTVADGSMYIKRNTPAPSNFKRWCGDITIYNPTASTLYFIFSSAGSQVVGQHTVISVPATTEVSVVHALANIP